MSTLHWGARDDGAEPNETTAGYTDTDTALRGIAGPDLINTTLVIVLLTFIQNICISTRTRCGSLIDSH